MRIRVIIDSLQAIGDRVSEQDQIGTVLKGIPEEYKYFVMMINDCVDPPFVDDFKALLLFMMHSLKSTNKNSFRPLFH